MHETSIPPSPFPAAPSQFVTAGVVFEARVASEEPHNRPCIHNAGVGHALVHGGVDHSDGASRAEGVSGD